MSNFGGFRKKEINGKSFLIFTFLTRPENSSSTSSSSSETTIVSQGNNNLFICPKLRRKAEESKRKEKRSPEFAPLFTSPLFPINRSGDQHVQHLLDSDSHEDICKLPLLPLFWCNNRESLPFQRLKKESFYIQCDCNACLSSDLGTDYYFCVTCDEMFHKECVESPYYLKSPLHPFVPLYLCYLPGYATKICFICKFQLVSICYYSPTLKLSIHPVCALKQIPFVIDHPKRHPHPLTFFPIQDSLACNVCGMIVESIPTYLCVPCVSLVHRFLIHQDCADSPTVIRISRHHHRISFISSLPSGKWSCGVCLKAVDNNYGAYSCGKCNGYFVHTRCALRRDLWDGEELEGVPEEPEIDVPPFEKIADGIILHLCHGHHLKLEVSRGYDEDKVCSACVLPVIFEEEFYSCMDQCDFILHEACANAPRRKHHPLYAHPLTLKVVTSQYQNGVNQGYFMCNACWRLSCGFVYETDQGGWAFKLDFRCALVSEPFEYKGHEHPLFLALKPEEENAAICQICQVEAGTNTSRRKLNCIESSFIICFRCATLPYKAWYKHDKHLLTFHKEKEESDESGWCEICEKKLVYSRKGGFYSCDDYCGTTLHVNCLLGEDPYMRPGHTIIKEKEEIHIVRNNTMSRPFCQHISRKYCVNERCPYGVVFKKGNKASCRLYCV